MLIVRIHQTLSISSTLARYCEPSTIESKDAPTKHWRMRPRQDVGILGKSFAPATEESPGIFSKHTPHPDSSFRVL
jgi:hypothetical protein